jgi:hypothetical protein
MILRSATLLLCAVMLTACSAVADGPRPVEDVTVLAGEGVPLTYNPTGEFIFPSVLDTRSTSLQTPHRYLLYYAPHDAPGGISLMSADSLDGPWSEFGANPIINASSPPHFEVSHVSSPDVVWDSARERVLLYFHGDNSTTRVAESFDGVTFTHLGVAVNRSGDEPDVVESSYARVTALSELDSSMTGFMMLYMDKPADEGRRIRVADSVDGVEWTVRAEPLIVPGGIEGENVSGANLWSHQGGIGVVYHSSTGDIWYRATDATVSQVSEPCVLLTDPSSTRLASPEIVQSDDDTYVFLERGDRLAASVVLAVLSPPLEACDTTAD